jgi:hypothetical protein
MFFRIRRLIQGFNRRIVTQLGISIFQLCGTTLGERYIVPFLTSLSLGATPIDFLAVCSQTPDVRCREKTFAYVA